MPQKSVVESKRLQTAIQERIIVKSHRKSREKQGFKQCPSADESPRVRVEELTQSKGEDLSSSKTPGKYPRLGAVVDKFLGRSTRG